MAVIKLRNIKTPDIETIALVEFYSRAVSALLHGHGAIPETHEKLAAHRQEVTDYFNNLAAFKKHDPFVSARVALIEDELIGYATTRISYGKEIRDRCGQLDNLFVHPAHWHRGVGRALMNDAMRILKTQGAEKAILFTPSRNLRSRGFYTKAGWHYLEGDYYIGAMKLGNAAVFEKDL